MNKQKWEYENFFLEGSDDNLLLKKLDEEGWEIIQVR